jgi:UDP:flavonoid glycosyltransferase YjiC (YdhE family)
VRILCATTANDGHFGPLVPFARACADAGHEVRVAAPASYAAAVARAGFAHEPFGDAPPALIGPIMARLPTLPFEEANDVVVREVFARIDAQAALPALVETVERWRPDLVLRESAELASIAAAERAGVPHVHVCIGMHEVAVRFARSIDEPLEELGRLTGLAEGRLPAALAAETVLSSVPELLDHATDGVSAGADAFLRFHERPSPAVGRGLPDWGEPDAPLVYVTFGSVAGSLPPFAGVFREALDALAGLGARVLMTVGRKVDPADLGPLPSNAHVVQWWPQEAVLPQAAAMLGHGGFGTTMGALAAGVPQVVVPLFSFDQVVNGAHVADVGAGLTVPPEPGAVATAATEVPRLLADPTFAESAGRVATALGELPPPSEAVPVLTGLARR